MPSRPELVAKPEVYYGAKEATRYTVAARPIQATLTRRPEPAPVHEAPCRRALELAGLLPRQGPGLLLDIGCGSGLSGEVCSAVGYLWVGADISHDMLLQAAQASAAQAASGTCCGLLQADMGRSLGVGYGAADASDGLFDGAISISAVQWLLARPDWWEASTRFFTALKRLLVPGSWAVLQIYVNREHEATKLLHAAICAGFVLPPAPSLSATPSSTGDMLDRPSTETAGPSFTDRAGTAGGVSKEATAPYCTPPPTAVASCCLLMDYPHNNAARKYSLVLQRPVGNGGAVATAATGAVLRVEGGGHVVVPAPGWCVQPAPDCPLAWHVGGTCALWWQHNAAPGHQGSMSAESARCLTFCAGQHRAHGRKLARLLQRAAVLAPAPPGLCSPCSGAIGTRAGQSEEPRAPTRKGRKRQQHSMEPDQPTDTPTTQPPAADTATASNSAQAGTGTLLTGALADFQHQPQQLRQWHAAHARCACTAQAPFVACPPTGLQASAYVRAPHLYACGGQTSVTVLARTGLQATEEDALHLMARVCGAHTQQVDNVKLEVVTGVKTGAAPGGVGQDHADKASDFDAYLGARVSCHHVLERKQGREQVCVGTLQAPGVVPPYCVVDCVWVQDTAATGSEAQQGKEGAGADQASTLHAAADHAAELLHTACGGSRQATGAVPVDQVEAATGAMQGMAAVAVLFEVQDCASLGTGGGVLCCRLMAALYDTCSSYNMPGVAASLLSQSESATCSSQEAPSNPSGSNGCLPGEQKQLLGLQTLHARLAALTEH